MAKSILDKAISVNPTDIETITGTMYAECKDCEAEWIYYDKWFREHNKPSVFHWSIACCDKHAREIRNMIEGR